MFFKKRGTIALLEVTTQSAFKFRGYTFIITDLLAVELIMPESFNFPHFFKGGHNNLQRGMLGCIFPAFATREAECTYVVVVN